MKILPKLMTGFMSLAALVLISGLVGVVISNNISSQTNIVIEEDLPAKDVAMEASISLLMAKEASAEYLLLTDGKEAMFSQIQEYLGDFQMWLDMLRLGTASNAFMQSDSGQMYIKDDVGITLPPIPDQIQPIVSEAQGRFDRFLEAVDNIVETHDQRIRYNFDYADKSWDISSFLTLVELQHRKWIDQLQEESSRGNPFTGETDPTKCFFGQWIYAYDDIDDPRMQEYLDELERVHKSLHETSTAINAAPSRTEKVEIFDNQTRPIVLSIEALFQEIQDYIGPLFESLLDQEAEELEQMKTISDEVLSDMTHLEEEVDAIVDISKQGVSDASFFGNIFLIIMIVVGVVLALIVGIVLSLGISRPVTAVAGMATQIARGQFDLQKLQIKNKDEIGDLATAFHEMMDSLKEKVTLLGYMEKGRLDQEVPLASEDDILGLSMREMQDSLNKILWEVDQAVVQMASGADQIATASQDLSQGATEQASSLEEIAASTNEIGGQSRQNSENANQAAQLAKKNTADAEGGNQLMDELLTVMSQITESSEKTKKIVRTIDDIAFQVNLLALNANVEAARAGKYGRGFAVVAEEVRTLAVRSAQAVQETTQMVEESQNRVEAGNEKAKITGQQLTAMVEASRKVSDFLDEISQASTEQAQGIDQINKGLGQIDEVTQGNTASAEESASAAEELSSQAQHLKNMLRRFTLKNGGNQRLLPGTVGATGPQSYGVSETEEGSEVLSNTNRASKKPPSKISSVKPAGNPRGSNPTIQLDGDFEDF